MHKPNHNEEDFFDLIARPVGVVPKNFEAAPQDNTGTNNDLIPPEPRLNLGKSLASPRQSSVSNAPMSDEEIADMAMGMVTPFAGTVRGLQAGEALAKTYTTNKGIDVYKGVKLLRDGKKMPEIATYGKHRNIYELGKKKLKESIYPIGTDRYGNNVTNHTYEIKPINDFTPDPRTSYASIKFNVTTSTTPSGQPYKLITKVDLTSPKAVDFLNEAGRFKAAGNMQKYEEFLLKAQDARKGRDAGKLLSNILTRTKGNWAIGEDNMSLDALNEMTTSFLKRASKVEFYNPSFDALPQLKSNNLGKFSEFAKRMNDARNQGIDPSIPIKEIADELTYRFVSSGKVQGRGELQLGDKLFKGKTIINNSGREIPYIEHPPFFLKSFKERLAAVVGMSVLDLDKYMEKDLSE